MKSSKANQLREGVRKAYSAAAQRPQDRHPFPVGRHFAESIGYPPDVLDGLPSVSVDPFCRVSNVAIFAEIPQGATVLDLGCGAGLDSLIAARRVGPGGRVTGVDFSEAMLARARRAVTEAGFVNVGFYQADAENLPIRSGSIDVALVNGIFNLNPARQAIFRELARVLRQGGEVYAAELILRKPLARVKAFLKNLLKIQTSQANWFA